MGHTLEPWTAAQMREAYGSFYAQGAGLTLDPKRIPAELFPLIPYAEFWGIPDDWTREDLLAAAPPRIKQNLSDVVAGFENALNDWLAGPEANSRSFSDEYIAFTAMRMAAD